MSTMNLDAAFSPKSVALIGASERPGRLGTLVLANILAGGFNGVTYAVNPKYDTLSGQKCYRKVSDLPAIPDLFVIATPASTIPGLIEDIGQFGGKAAVIITAGIGEADGLKARMLQAAGKYGVRIIGPNTIGILIPTMKLNASFTHIPARSGSLALLSQSGAIVSSVVDWAEAEDVGFSHIVSLGDMADVDVSDCLNMLANDTGTSAILMYLESLSHGRKFMSAARAAARMKPIIAVKPGRHEATARAALTHTGALAGADGVTEAALRRSGIIRVRDLEDLFSAAAIAARFKPLERGRVAIITNGGGAGVLAVDHLLDRGIELAQLSSETISSLDAKLPANWSRSNPIDIIGDATPDRYEEAIGAAAADPRVDALLVMNCPTALASPRDAAQHVADLTTGGYINGKPLLATWLGEYTAEPARDVLTGKGLASLETPAQAAEAVSLLVRWNRLGQQLQRVPTTFETLHADRATAAAIIQAAGKSGRTMLTEPEAKGVLRAYGILVPVTVRVKDIGAVESAAAQLLTQSRAVAVKMMSETLTHKSDLGGVVLNCQSPAAASEAARTIVESLRSRGLEEQLQGFTVQEMIVRPEAEELIIGVHLDPVFGPVLLFGAGGIAVEVTKDTTMELLPVDDILAEDMIDRTRISALLKGFRNRPAADRASLVKAMKAVSQLVIDCPAIKALDINPILADHNGIVALDARIELDLAQLGTPLPNPLLSIRPYPQEWSTEVRLDQASVLIRPAKPVDAELCDEFFRKMASVAEGAPASDRAPGVTGRGLQFDYDREIVFLALAHPQGELVGLAQYVADPDGEAAEFSLVLRDADWERELGKALMQRLIDFARSRCTRQLCGTVEANNQRMIAIYRDLGFRLDMPADGPGPIRLSLDTSAAPPAPPLPG
jgi:acetyltransferase